LAEATQRLTGQQRNTRIIIIIIIIIIIMKVELMKFCMYKADKPK